MAFLRVPLVRKPPGPVNLDPSNPITYGIVSCVPMLNGYGSPIDILANPPRVATGLATWSVGQSGITGAATGFTNATTTDIAFSTAATAAFSAAIVVNITDATGAGNVNIFGRTAYSSETVNSGWAFNVDTTPAYHFRVFNNNGAANYELATTTLLTAGDHVLVGTNNGTNLRSLYLDGRLEATTTLNPIPLATANPSNLCNPNNQLYLGVVWNRVLSDAEAVSFMLSPWQIFLGASLSSSFIGLALASIRRPYNLWSQIGPILAQ